ncbi:keratinocyte-associated protein 3-like [Physeter macrocephalus]|uniref:Keratinocyte-associated protein 3-like n=1 Tax=Physeter macrocephalus TaxID=9755 RepID=A0A455BTT2_PHYMC|nr:keratinocyte-associated protein 3-like [Physeter catodon]|eukprot:XP_028352390.1 keratinocyte-associated protein 3-like [Physeter catodon]
MATEWGLEVTSQVRDDRGLYEDGDAAPPKAVSEDGEEVSSKPPSDGGISLRAQGALLVVLEMVVDRESFTVANGGRRLIADCHPGLLDPLLPLDQGPGHTDCPFDPTRIYDTALALWIPSLLMSAAEAALSGYCCVAALTLRGVGPCRKEGLQEQLEELTALELPKCKRQENEQLLDQTREILISQKSWV